MSCVTLLQSNVPHLPACLPACLSLAGASSYGRYAMEAAQSVSTRKRLRDVDDPDGNESEQEFKANKSAPATCTRCGCRASILNKGNICMGCAGDNCVHVRTDEAYIM